MLNWFCYLLRPNDKWEFNFNERTGEWELLEFLADIKFGEATSVWMTRWKIGSALLADLPTERVQPLLVRNLKRFYGA